MKLPQNLRCSRGLLEPDAWKAGTSGSEGAPAQQCVGATRRLLAGKLLHGEPRIHSLHCHLKLARYPDSGHV